MTNVFVYPFIYRINNRLCAQELIQLTAEISGYGRPYINRVLYIRNDESLKLDLTDLRPTLKIMLCYFSEQNHQEYYVKTIATIKKKA